jgi:hypothetical protein
MQVFLTRDLHGDAEHELLRSKLPNLTAIGYQVTRAEASLLLDIEAASRVDAEANARRAAESVLAPGDIARVGGADDGMQNRQVMLWLLATRRQVRRWEVVLAAEVRAQLSGNQAAGGTVWTAQIERHLAFVAANNLLRALDNADDRFLTIPEDLATDVRTNRDLQEHWDEQWPAFYNATSPGPLRRSGKVFAERHPGATAYSFLHWNSKAGPQLGRGVSVTELYAFLDALENEVLTAAPELADFIVEVEPSPWLGSANGDEPWWPTSPTTEAGDSA